MKADLLPVPGVVLGSYPERRARDRRPRRPPQARFPVRFALGGRYDAFMKRFAAVDSALGAVSPETLRQHTHALRAHMAARGLADDLIAEAFALAKRAIRETFAIDLHATQLYAARIMLDGRLAEMATGEGKTFAAGVCAATAALAGIPIHVITANDYLVARDAQSLGPFYAALGLTTGSVTARSEPAARQAQYRADIVYATASELAFDYLRDGLLRGSGRSALEERFDRLGAPRVTRLRGLCMALVDEADSVLIDDARVPLILSAPAREANTAPGDVALALELAQGLDATADFKLDGAAMSAELTAQGRARVQCRARDIAAAWRNARHRDELVCTALAALHLYRRDRDYLLREGRVSIVDPATGRIAPGRVWSRGLHQLVEAKERCAPTAETVTIAQITYQRLFRRYLRLCGMSGTLTEARRELKSVYGLHVVRVPLARPGRRQVLPTRLFADEDAQWRAVIDETLEVNRAGRPVLIGTASVADSETLSRRLAAAGLAHAVLNARQDHEEARIVSEAGRARQITVATNMAGRGTDIALGEGVAALGGLHVICCDHSASRRIERQFIGRCARRGDPGSARSLLAPGTLPLAGAIRKWLVRIGIRSGLERPRSLVRMLVVIPQLIEEAKQHAQRRTLLENDIRAAEGPCFGRPTE